MNLHPVTARQNWREQMQEWGYLTHLLDNPPYWVEATDAPFCAHFSAAEIIALKAATEELNRLVLSLVDRICTGTDSESYFDFLRVPPFFREAARQSWRRGDRSLYGRFDLAFNEGKIKLLELNFDTPTSLYESGLLQSLWFHDLKNASALPADATQFNSLEERLMETLRRFIPGDKVLHLGTFEHAIEETENLKYLKQCAERAGVDAEIILFDHLRNDNSGQMFDQQMRPLTTLFKLYPWELLLADDGETFARTGHYLFEPLVRTGNVQMLEPGWKAVLTSKAALQLLWQMAPNHPNLLETTMDDDSDRAKRMRESPHARKPVYGREGAGVSINFPDGSAETSSTASASYAQEEHALQEYCPVQAWYGHHLVVGSWLVDGRSAGICVRADRSKITSRKALFVPHYVAN